ncbi:MAG: hypothetical protein ACLTEE_17955 [Anaerobutyricum hallii]
MSISGNAGKTEKEISGMIETAADKATVKSGCHETEEHERTGNQDRNNSRAVRRGESCERERAL